MRRLLPIYLAAGVSLGVILAYLLAGGASYKPLEAADPCEPRSLEVLAERGTLEAIALSALDGAACELQVSREELLAALADDAALQEFSSEHSVEEAEVDAAVRAGLVRAVDDAERAGLISASVASVARGLAESAPVPVVIDLFQALPGNPSLPELIAAVGELGLDLEALGDLGLEQLGDELERLLPEGLDRLLPEGLQLPESLPGLTPEGLEALRDLLQQG